MNLKIITFLSMGLCVGQGWSMRGAHPDLDKMKENCQQRLSEENKALLKAEALRGDLTNELSELKIKLLNKKGVIK